MMKFSPQLVAWFVILFAVSAEVWPTLHSPRSVGVKSLLLRLFDWFGGIGAFCAQMVKGVITPPYEFKELLRQMDQVGAKSLPLVALAGGAIGVVLSLHTRDSLIRFGAKSLLPAVIILSIVKESGPIITALVVSGRVAAGIGAELGSMRVTEQIDAIEASAVNPYKFLVSPRVIACMLMLPLLTLAADFTGILMGWIATTAADPISWNRYWEEGTKNLRFRD